MNAGPCSSRRRDVGRELAELHEFSRLLEYERLRVFRHHLGSAIREVSPIVIDLAELVGTNIDDVAAAFRPPPQWPSLHLGTVDGRQEGSSGDREVGGHMLGGEGSVRFTGSHVLSLERMTCSFRLSNGRIEAMAVIGDTSIQTSADRASLLIPRAEGGVRPVAGATADQLAPTNLLSGRGYGIERVDDGFVPGRMLVTLRTGMHEVMLTADGAPCGGEVSDDGD